MQSGLPLTLRVHFLQRVRNVFQQLKLLLTAGLSTSLDHSEQNQLDVVLPCFVLQQKLTHATLI